MQPNHLDELFAYSIQAHDSGWTWRVYDMDGAVIAEGSAPTKLAAHSAIGRVYGQESWGRTASAALWGRG